MKLAPLLILEIFGSSWLWTQGSTLESVLPVQFVPPIHLEKVPRMTIYEDTILLMFEITLPNIFGEQSPAKLNTKCDPENISCHYAHLDSILAHPYAKEIKVMHKSTLDPPKSGWRARPISTKIFPALFTSDDQLNIFFTRLKNSSRNSDFENLLVLNRVNKFAVEINRKMDDLQVNLNEDPHSATTQIHSAFSLFHRLSFKKTAFDWFTDSLENCKSGKIPIQWIPPGLFYAKLNDLNFKLNKLNFTLSISANDPGAYFDLSSLTECIVTNTRAIVALHVPYRRISDQWEVFNPIDTKFARGDGTACQIESGGPSIPSLVARSRENNHLEIINNVIPNCDVTKDLICLLPAIFNSPKGQGGQPVKCIKGILEGQNVEKLQTLCDFTCTPSSRNIDSIGEHTLRVTGAEKIEVSCDSGSTSILTSVHKIGAIDLTLKCSCKFIIDNEEPLKPSLGCVDNNNLEVKDLIRQVVPNVWSQLTNFSSRDVLERQDFSMFDYAWEWKVKVVNVGQEGDAVSQAEGKRSKLKEKDEDDEDLDVWKVLCILSVVGLSLSIIVSWGTTKCLNKKIRKLDCKIRGVDPKEGSSNC